MFLVYVSITYRGINPYLKGVHLTLDSWRQYRDDEEWILRGEEFKIDDVEGKWEGI